MQAGAGGRQGDSNVYEKHGGNGYDANDPEMSGDDDDKPKSTKTEDFAESGCFF